MDDGVHDIVWNAYAAQSSMGHDVVIILPDMKRIYALGSIIASRAPALLDLMNYDLFPKEVNLRSSAVSPDAFKAVLDYIHGAHDVNPPRLKLSRDFPALCLLLQAADYCGAQKCKLWVERIIIDDHLSSLEIEDLQRLTQDARALHAALLYEAADKELAQRDTEPFVNPHAQGLEELMFQQAGKRRHRNQELVVGTESGKLTMFDAATGSTLGTVEAHSDIVWCVTYSYDGSLIASCSADKSIRLWSSETYECLRGFRNAHTDHIRKVAFSRFGDIFLASASDDLTCKIWNTSTGACLKMLTHECVVLTVAFSPTDESQLATGCSNRKVRLWNTETELFRPLEGHQSPVWSIAYSRDGTEIISAGGSICILWDVGTATRLRSFEHADVRRVIYSPDGTSIVSMSGNGRLKVWDGYTTSCLRELRVDLVAESLILDYLTCAYSPDGTMITCGYRRAGNWKIGLWDVRTFDCVRIIETPSQDPLFSLAAQPSLQS